MHVAGGAKPCFHCHCKGQFSLMVSMSGMLNWKISCVGASIQMKESGPVGADAKSIYFISVSARVAGLLLGCLAFDPFSFVNDAVQKLPKPGQANCLHWTLILSRPLSLFPSPLSRSSPPSQLTP